MLNARQASRSVVALTRLSPLHTTAAAARKVRRQPPRFETTVVWTDGSSTKEMLTRRRTEPVFYAKCPKNIWPYVKTEDVYVESVKETKFRQQHGTTENLEKEILASFDQSIHKEIVDTAHKARGAEKGQKEQKGQKGDKES